MNELNINRKQAEQVFAFYVSKYNEKDEKIKLKIDHTYRVCELCEQIAKSLKLNDKQVDLAWLLGLLHDIGRFEQLKQYGTFVDSESIDHAQFGAKLLFDDHLIREFITSPDYDEWIKTAVYWHSAYRLPEELDETMRMYCNILRDADKIDILKVNMVVPPHIIYNVTIEELEQSTVTKAVMDNFFSHKATLRTLKKTPIDHLVGHLSLVFELVYPKSLELAKQQGFIEQLLDYPTKNLETKKQFEQLRSCMREYLEQR